MSLTISCNAKQVASEESESGGSEDEELSRANNEDIRNPVAMEVIRHEGREMKEPVGMNRD